MRNFFRTIFSSENIEFYNSGSRYSSFSLSLFFALISAILTGLNIWKQYTFMACTTVALVIGFLCAAYFSKAGRPSVSRIITALMCGLVFSVYAVTGGNNGFAILWIILIPVVSYMLVGLKTGFVLSAYFQVFLFVLFYTPVSKYVQDYYTPTFVMRFPVLYAASFVSITILMVQRQRLYNQIHHQAYYDAMTDLCNRRRYNEILAAHTGGIPSVIVFDLNRLKYFNDTAGHEAGDEMIRAAAELIREAFRPDECFRTGGDEFAVISRRSPAELDRAQDKFRKAMAEWKGTLVPSINVSLGAAYSSEHPGVDLPGLIKLADQCMYAEKEIYYRTNGFERRQSSLKTED